MIDVLHVIDQLAPGGAERNLLAMVRELNPLGVRSHVAWLFGRGGLEEEFGAHAETMIPLEVERPSQLPKAIVHLSRRARALAPDVVHGQLLVAHLAARVVAKTCRRPIVTTWQNVIYERRALDDFGGSRRLRGLFRGVDWLSSTRDAYYVAVSEHVRDQWSKSVGVPRARVQVIPNVVEPERCRAVSDGEIAEWRARYSIDADAEVLVSVGRLVAGKGHAEAIAAMRLIVDARPRARLLIAGTGPGEAELRSVIARHGLTAQVTLLGYQPETAPIYALASLFLFATHSEGLPLTLGEALGAGLPAAISGIAPNCEVARALPSVRYFPVGNIGRIATAAIELLAAGEPMRALARAASAEIRHRYDPVHVARQLADVFVTAAHRR